MFPSVNSPTLSAPDKCFPPWSKILSFSFCFFCLLSFHQPTIFWHAFLLLHSVRETHQKQRNAQNARECAKCREMRRMQSNWSALSLTLLLPSFFTFSTPTYHSSFLKTLFFISFPTGTCAAVKGSKLLRELSLKNIVFQNSGRKYKGTQMIIIFFNCLYLYQFDFIILSDKCFSSRSGALYQCPLSSYTEDCQQASPSTNCISRSNNILMIAAGRDWRAPPGRWSLWWASWGSAAATSAHRDQGGPVAWGSCHQPGWDNWAFVAGVGWGEVEVLWKCWC